MVPVLTVEELKARLDAGEAITLLDVREPDELEISRLEGVVEVPLGQLPDRIGELDPNATPHPLRCAQPEEGAFWFCLILSLDSTRLGPKPKSRVESRRGGDWGLKG